MFRHEGRQEVVNNEMDFDATLLESPEYACPLGFDRVP